jgi:hypothetical protein
MSVDHAAPSGTLPRRGPLPASFLNHNGGDKWAGLLRQTAVRDGRAPRRFGQTATCQPGSPAVAHDTGGATALHRQPADTTTTNVRLHTQVTTKLAETGGMVSDELKHRRRQRVELQFPARPAGASHAEAIVRRPARPARDRPIGPLRLSRALKYFDRQVTQKSHKRQNS